MRRARKLATAWAVCALVGALLAFTPPDFGDTPFWIGLTLFLGGLYRAGILITEGDRRD